MKNSNHTEGIILKAIDFRDYDQILNVLTIDCGIVKLIIKNKKPSANQPHAKLSPMTRAEFIFTPNQSEIWKCTEINPINHYFTLREKYSWLQTGAKLLQVVSISQIGDKPIPLIYKLLVSYLEKIPAAPSLPALEMSFMLKILKHEGLINTSLQCCACQTPLEVLHISRGDHYCGLHTPLNPIKLNQEEVLAFMQLAACKTFSDLYSISIPQSLETKVQRFFSEKHT